jgi:hypothetical protein
MQLVGMLGNAGAAKAELPIQMPPGAQVQDERVERRDVSDLAGCEPCA